MLYSTFGSEPKSTRSKSLVPISLGISILLIAVAVLITQHFRGSPVAAISSPTKAAAASWTVHCGSDKFNKGGQTYSGSVAPGGVLFLPAGAQFRIKAHPAGAGGSFAEENAADAWDHSGGELEPPVESAEGCTQDGRAPQQPGLYTLVWRDEGDSVPTRSISVMVLAKAEMHLQGDRTQVKVNGKSIGSYGDPDHAPVKRVRENAQRYQVPRYFATLTPEFIKLRFGHDFELGQLVAYKDYRDKEGKKVYTTERHTDVFPPRVDLIEKLVKLRDRLRSKGVKVSKFWITSGFRTPEYNREIHGALFSRHCYGDAVDLVIDEDNDKRMDDLNGDGKVDRKDGIVIGNAARELELEGTVVPGGIGVYEWDGEDSVKSHVHIDCRGYISRWGQNGMGRHKKTFTWWPKSEFSDEDGE
ncbi:MAG TPA: D-Ala-D-Ala carboxypeptidase family metallohydrolase [Planctomycetota bacterium]|nr:D-Ala-D-Ala carboxypeptidase family metallohydrolase [Planctomycetota bacterium]